MNTEIIQTIKRLTIIATVFVLLGFIVWSVNKREGSLSEGLKIKVEPLVNGRDLLTSGDIQKIIDELKQLNINIKLITDGDVLGALYVTNPKYNVDIFLGIGGGPEGVLAASALDAFDCHFQGRFIFDNEKDIK